MNPALKTKIIEQLSEMERLLSSLHRNAEGKEYKELGYAYVNVREARQAVEGRLPNGENTDSAKPLRITKPAAPNPQ